MKRCDVVKKSAGQGRVDVLWRALDLVDMTFAVGKIVINSYHHDYEVDEQIHSLFK